MTRLDRRTTRSADGTPIAYRVSDLAPRTRTLVLAGGLGASHVAWQPQIDYLASRFRVVTWDYRGLFGAEPGPCARGAASTSVARYDLRTQLADLQAVLATAGVDKLVLMGWSGGVRLALEAAHALGDRVEALVLIGGNAGAIFRGLKWACAAHRGLSKLAGWQPGTGTAPERLRRSRLARRLMASWLERLGLAGTAIPAATLDPIIEAFLEVDFDAYVATLAALSTREAFPLLGVLRVPTLVLCGQDDPLMPPATAHEMARKIPCSEVMVVRGGRHYLGLEYPDLVNLRIERFLQDAHLC